MSVGLLHPCLVENEAKPRGLQSKLTQESTFFDDQGVGYFIGLCCGQAGYKNWIISPPPAGAIGKCHFLGISRVFLKLRDRQALCFWSLWKNCVGLFEGKQKRFPSAILYDFRNVKLNCRWLEILMVCLNLQYIILRLCNDDFYSLFCEVRVTDCQKTK